MRELVKKEKKKRKRRDQQNNTPIERGWGSCGGQLSVGGFRMWDDDGMSSQQQGEVFCQPENR